jgi:hypothetical protein
MPGLSALATRQSMLFAHGRISQIFPVLWRKRRRLRHNTGQMRVSPAEFDRTRARTWDPLIKSPNNHTIYQ